MSNERFFIRPDRRSNPIEVSEDQAREHFLSTCAYVGYTDDRFPDWSIAFGRTTGAKTRMVVNVVGDIELTIDPQPDLSYAFLLDHNHWDPVMAAVRDEIANQTHRPKSESRRTMTTQDYINLAIIHQLESGDPTFPRKRDRT